MTFDELTETGNLKTGILWDLVTDEQIYFYCNNLEDISIDLLDDVLSCHSVEFDSSFHKMQHENLYNNLMQCLYRLIIALREKVSKNLIVS